MGYALAVDASTGLITEAMKTAFSTGLSDVRAAVIDMATVALPIGISIAGLFLAVRLAMKFFHSVAN